MRAWKTWSINVTAMLVLLWLTATPAAAQESVYKDTARLRINLVTVLQLAEQLKRTPIVEKTAVGDLISEVAEEWAEYRDSFEKVSTLEIGYVFSRIGGMVYSVMPLPFVQAIGDMDVLLLDQPGKTTLDDEPAEVAGQYIAANLDAESDDGTKPLDSDMRICLKKQARRVTDSSEVALFEAIIRPSGFLRNAAIEVYVKQAEAYLMTEAQERDGETIGTSDYRKFGIHVLTNLLRTVTKDIDELELGGRKLNGGYCTELIITAEKNSALSTYFARLNNIRNRSVAWLHPDHDSFFSVCLPLPDMVIERLKQLNTANQDLTTVSGIPQTLTGALTRWEEELAESKQIEWLHQTIPGEYGRSHVIVIPGRNNFELTESAIHLVSSEETSDVLQPYVTTVENYAVHEITTAMTMATLMLPGLRPLSEEDVAYVIPTPECLMLVTGHPNDCLDIAEELIARDFERPPAAARYARTAIGGEFSEATSRSMLLASGLNPIMVVSESTTEANTETFTYETEDGPVTVEHPKQQNPVESSQPKKAAPAKPTPRAMGRPASFEELENTTVPGFQIGLLVNEDQVNLRTTFPKDGEAVMIAFVSKLLMGLQLVSGAAM